jgi:hypothetical protein
MSKPRARMSSREMLENPHDEKAVSFEIVGLAQCADIHEHSTIDSPAPRRDSTAVNDPKSTNRLVLKRAMNISVALFPSSLSPFP